MFNKYKINKYFNLDSIIHKLNPVFKIIIFLITLLSVVFIHNILNILIMLVYFGLIINLSNINYKVYIKNILIFRYFYIIIIILCLLFGGSILSSIIILFKIIGIVLLFIILTLTTSWTEILYGIERIFRKFNKVFSINIVSLKLTLIFRFISLYIFEIERILISQMSRGLDINRSNIKTKLYLIKNIIVNAYKNLKVKNNNFIDVINIRLFDVKTSRSNYRLNNKTLYDIILLNLSILIFIIIIIF